MNTPSSKLPNLTKDTEDFINDMESRNNKPLYEMSPQEARDFLSNLQAETYDKHIEAQVEEMYIDGVKTFFVKPSNTIDFLPVILYIHGGGWVMGNEFVFDNLIKKIAIYTNSLVVFPEYTLAPEAQYPQQLDEIYSVLKYINENEEDLKADTTHLGIIGDSVGANMATVTVMKAKEDIHIPKFCFQILIYPVTNSDMDTKSYESFALGPWLTKKSMEYFWDAYMPDVEYRHDKFVSPLHADLDDLQGMPTTLVITVENDVLRDEGEAYARKLDNAGVDVINVRINGTIHDFMMLNAISQTEAAQTTLKIICGVITESFEQ